MLGGDSPAFKYEPWHNKLVRLFFSFCEIKTTKQPPNPQAGNDEKVSNFHMITKWLLHQITPVCPVVIIGHIFASLYQNLADYSKGNQINH